jgi:hypothetical protein
MAATSQPTPPYLDRRRAQRDRDDEALLAAMKDAPGATIGNWAEAIGKSRTSTVTALHRLRDGDLVTNESGAWALVSGCATPREAARWIEPVSAAAREHRAHASA